MGKHKSSKLIRVSKATLERLAPYKETGMSWARTLDSYLSIIHQPNHWVLPSTIFTTHASAVKHALELAAKANLPFEEREIPIKVKRVL